MPREEKVYCYCCNSFIPPKRERDHRAKLYTPYHESALNTSRTHKRPRLAAISSLSSDDDSDSRETQAEVQDMVAETSSDHAMEAELPTYQDMPPLMDVEDESDDDDESDGEGGEGESDGEDNEEPLPTKGSQPGPSPKGRRHVEIFDSDSDLEDNEDAACPAAEDDDPDLIDDDDEEAFPDWDSFEYPPTDCVSAWDLLGEKYEQEFAAVAEKLSAYDRAICRAFAFKLQANLTDKAYAKVPLAFPSENPLPKIHGLRSRVAFLAGFKPQRYDCCVNSCCCFTGRHAELKQCPYCDEDRFQANGKPRKYFTYIPLIPRLLALIGNTDCAKQMLYRSRQSLLRTPGVISDVFDADGYANLRTKNVEVEGKELPHKYFSDSRDIALGLSTDGFAPFKRRKKTAWPLIIFNFNLPPEIRYHVEEILSLGVIPGPKKPHDIDSFLWPLVLELIELSKGVTAFDSLESKAFSLHAYLILVFGDIPAVALLMHMKGHNGFSPCRMCKILGVRTPGSRATTHYVPHDRSSHPEVLSDPTAVRSYDMDNLPLRTHEEFLAQADEVQSAPTTAEADRLAKKYGIKGIPILSYLKSLIFPTSFPYDFMHLIWENLIKNLVLHWTGEFKDLDEGQESYNLPKTVWEAVGAATATSGSTIPSAYGVRVPNVAADSTIMSADMWSFWTLYLGPVLLRRRFNHLKYFDHFIALVRLLNTCLQFEISFKELDGVRSGFVKWVRDYERMYYQNDPARVSACPVTVHALLHIADSIKLHGPVWCYWAFAMERYCGLLQPSLRSRRFPYASLDRFVVETAQLTQIKLISGLVDELSLRLPRGSLPGSFKHPSYPTCVLLPPMSPTAPPSNMINNIAAAFATRGDVHINKVRKLVEGAVIHEWAKVRRVDSEAGDTMRAFSMLAVRDDSRDATFVRYEVLVDINAKHPRRKSVYRKETCYGQLQHLFLIRFSELTSTTRRTLGLTDSLNTEDVVIMAAIRSCHLEADDPHLNGLDVHFYSRNGPLHVVDIQSVQCLVGRVKDGERGWAIIDRSGSLARAICSEENEDENDE